MVDHTTHLEQVGLLAVGALGTMFPVQTCSTGAVVACWTVKMTRGGDTRSDILWQTVEPGPKVRNQFIMTKFRLLHTHGEEIVLLDLVSFLTLPVGTDVALPLSGLVGEIAGGAGLWLVAALGAHQAHGTDYGHAAGGGGGAVVALGAVSFLCGQTRLLAVEPGRTVCTLSRGRQTSGVGEGPGRTLDWGVCS